MLKVTHLLSQLQAVSAQTGKSAVSQLSEIVHLKRRVKYFGVSDYFTHRVYKVNGQHRQMQEDFAGWRMEKWLDDQLNPPAWRTLAEDKIVAYTLLANQDFPIPRVRAVYDRSGRGCLDAIRIADPQQFAEFLRDGISYPFFLKPVVGVLGGGALAVKAHHADSDAIEFFDGTTCPVADLVARLAGHQRSVDSSRGFLLQELLHQAPELEAMTGRTVSTARIVVLKSRDQALPFRAVWRVATGDNMTDNFAKGRTGNLLAAVNLDSGAIERVVSGFGVEQKEFENHPDTGARLVGQSLPAWADTLSLLKQAAVVFPMLQFQHWDVAFTDRGPVLVEINTPGAIDILQYASGRGLYDTQLREFVARNGTGVT